MRNGKSLTKIIDDILDIAKVESGKLEAEHIEISVPEIIDDVLETFREPTKAKGIYLRARISPDFPERLMSDPTRIRQILINIIGNAIKLTECGGITVEADSTTSRKFGGTGLGLALSKCLSEALGGNIAVEESSPSFRSRRKLDRQ